MTGLSDRLADTLVHDMSTRAAAVAAEREGLRGPAHAEERKVLRLREQEYLDAIAGINTGEGITRGSVVRELNELNGGGR